MVSRTEQEKTLKESGYLLAEVAGNRVCNICGFNTDQVIIQNATKNHHYYCSSCTNVFLSKINPNL